jgi:hypothetical protein
VSDPEIYRPQRAQRRERIHLPIWVNIILTVIPVLLTIATAIGSAYVWNAEQKLKTEKAAIDSENSAQDRQFGYLRDQLESEKEYTRTLSDRITDLNSRNYQLVEENVRLKLAQASDGTPAIDVIRRFVQADPGIAWFKIRVAQYQYTMGGVSAGYGPAILCGPGDNYIGRRDHEFFPTDVAEEFAREDEKVFRTQDGVIVRNRLEIPCNGFEGFFEGRKFHVRLDTGEDLIVGSGILVADETELLDGGERGIR